MQKSKLMNRVSLNNNGKKCARFDSVMTFVTLSSGSTVFVCDTTTAATVPGAHNTS